MNDKYYGEIDEEEYEEEEEIIKEMDKDCENFWGYRQYLETDIEMVEADPTLAFVKKFFFQEMTTTKDDEIKR